MKNESNNQQMNSYTIKINNAFTYED